MNIKKNIEVFIGSYLAGESTFEEKKSLESWLNEHPDNLHKFNQYKKIWNLRKQKKLNKENAFHKLTQRIELQTIEINRRKQKHTFFYALTFAASIVILIGSYFLFQFSLNTFFVPADPQIITNETPYGKKLKLQLPDGSRVYLNSGSTIQYPKSFNNHERKISFTGEGFFEVTHSKNPFIINIYGHIIQVLGTSFNVKTIEETGNIETIVISGKVKFSSDTNQSITNETYIEPGEKLHYNKTSRQIHKTKLENYDEIAWKDGILVFKNDAMKDVFSELEKWYGVKFMVSSKHIMQCSLTAKFDNQSLQEILDYIDVIMPLKYSISENNDSIIVLGKGCYDVDASVNN